MRFVPVFLPDVPEDRLPAGRFEEPDVFAADANKLFHLLDFHIIACLLFCSCFTPSTGWKVKYLFWIFLKYQGSRDFFDLFFSVLVVDIKVILPSIRNGIKIVEDAQIDILFLIAVFTPR